MVIALVQARLHTSSVVGLGPPAAALWQRLRRSFPWTIAATLRVRSIVWLGRVASLELARRTMERVCSATRRALGWPKLDIDVREVSPPRVGTVSRHVHGLGHAEGPDPQVPLPGWSTARDLLGGAADPWVLPRVHGALTWGRGGCWERVALPETGLDRGAWLGPVRAALRAPWLHSTAPTVAGLMRGVRARVRGEGSGPVPSHWVDAALRCALDPRLQDFPQPPAPPGRRPEVTSGSSLAWRRIEERR